MDGDSINYGFFLLIAIFYLSALLMKNPIPFTLKEVKKQYPAIGMKFRQSISVENENGNCVTTKRAAIYAGINQQ